MAECWHLTIIQITYALSGHELNVAIIFSSLQFFNVGPALLYHLISGYNIHFYL